MDNVTMKKNTDGRPVKSGNRHWSAMDTVILVLVLLAIGGLIFRVVDMSRKDRLTKDETMYVIRFTVEDTHREVLSEITGAEKVYLYEGDALVGYFGVYRDEATNMDSPALTIVPPRGDAPEGHVGAEGYLVCTTGKAMNGGLLIGESGQYLIPGSEVAVRTDRVLLTLRVTEIRRHG